MIALRPASICLALLALGSGCKRPAVRTYLAPRESIAPVTARAPERNTNAAPPPTAPRPKLAYETPPGWEPAEPGQISALNFAIAAADGAASVNVTPLGNFAGREPMLVNMWRTQVGAPALSEEDAAKTLSTVELAGGMGQLFEVTGTREGKPNRIVTAMLHRPESSWFFKLAGDEPVVEAQKLAFLAFLKTFRFEDPLPPASAPH